MMSTRRTLFTLGALAAAVALLPGTALAQDLTGPTSPSATVASYDEIIVTWVASSDADTSAHQVGYVAHATAEDFDILTPKTMTAPGGATANRATLTGLMAGTRYIIGVRALDPDAAAEADQMSTWVYVAGGATTDALDAIGQVMDLELEAGDESIMAMWDEVEDDIGIHHYKVNVTAAGGFSLEMGTGSDANEYMIENLTNGTEYTVKVAAVGMNPDGSADMDGDGTPERLGAFSATKKATPMAGAGDGMDDEDDEDDMMATPALPLFGILALFAGLLAAGRARLRR